MSSVYAFGAFELDPEARRLTRDGAVVTIADRHLGVLLALVTHAGSVLSKDALVEAGWQDVAVTDNSLEQAVSALRRVIGNAPDGLPCIQTVPRQGYRFISAVKKSASRASDDTLDALLAPHRAWVEGRAALETLERDGINRARAAFEQVLRSVPAQPAAHIGLANACALQFEMTRTDASPDAAALQTAVGHAREACRLDPVSGEAWATLGFVLERTGQRLDAAAATRRAISLEPDNWRHHLRLSYGSWGEERLRAAHRTLTLLPGLPLAHWLAATVHVARQALDDAERELQAGIAAQRAERGAQAWQSRFSAVGLHWLDGLIALARGDDEGALAAFERELSVEPEGHLYSRECAANTWYTIGVLRQRQTRLADARAAFAEALRRVPRHPTALVASAGLADVSGHGSVPARPETRTAGGGSIEATFAAAAALALAGSTSDASRLVDTALAAAPPGTSAGWTLPIEPLLDVRANPSVWAPPLARLRTRAA